MTDLTHAVLDRVFEQVCVCTEEVVLMYRISRFAFRVQTGRPFTSGVPNRMGYEDFIVFFMSEEDKTSEAALRFWFNVCDVDGEFTP
jgi:hypothetical protein